nr:CHAP domain-containing protein [Ciceribacter sp. L1K22]
MSGVTRGGWATAFVSWVTAKAGNPKGIAPSISASQYWRNALATNSAFSAESIGPRAGDVVVFVRDIVSVGIARGDNGRLWKGHIGIVWRVTPDTFEMISGNSNDRIELSVENRDDPNIVGFIRQG